MNLSRRLEGGNWGCVLHGSDWSLRIDVDGWSWWRKAGMFSMSCVRHPLPVPNWKLRRGTWLWRRQAVLRKRAEQDLFFKWLAQVNALYGEYIVLLEKKLKLLQDLQRLYQP